MKNYLFLGFAVPEEKMQEITEEDESPQMQNFVFNWSLIKALESQLKNKYTYVSSEPISEYPHYPKRIIGKNEWEVLIDGKAIRILGIPFYNKSLIKIITRFFSSLYYSIKEFRNKKDKGGIIVYTVHVPYMYAGYILSKIYNIDLIGIWTDPPSVIGQGEAYIKRKLRNTEEYMSRFIMSKFDKLIVLTKYLAEDFSLGTPYMVMEGIIDESLINKDSQVPKGSECATFLYTGALEKRYGTDKLVNAFVGVENSKLVICGSGSYSEDIIEISNKNKNIEFLGLVPRERVIQLQREADFLVNTRDSQLELTKYTFPSKTMEYMASGTPLLTTILPGFPQEYEKYVIKLKSNDIMEIRKMIKVCFEMTEEERKKIGENAKEFIKTKSSFLQGARMVKFLDE